MSTKLTSQVKASSKHSFTPVHAGLLQRKCGCGGPAGLTGNCEECSNSRLNVQRRADNQAEPSSVPPIVHNTPRSPGQPLDAETRAFMEPRFGHDFSNVRVHANERAAQTQPLLPLGNTAKPLGEPYILQRREAEQVNLLQGNTDATENRTGMPDKLRAGLEQLSGLDLSSVRVNYNSSKPAQVDALAYTEGKDIQLGPGQERHLPHEGWHVVQQMQGRVKPTVQAKGILINDDDALEREADVMGAKASVLGKQAGAGDFHTSIAAADKTVLDDQPFGVAIKPTLTGQSVTSQRVRQELSASNVPVLQRAASFVAGSVSNTKNIAASVIARDTAIGSTPTTLNGSEIKSVAAAQAAIRPPILAAQSNSDGTVGTRVATVPTNEASFTMTLPTSGPWTTVTKKANVAALFSAGKLAAQAGCSTDGDSTFRINGKPTDADFAANVRTHEDIHAADHERGFNSVIVPWDTKLEAAKTAGTVFNGATEADAEAALFTAMGGTPSLIATLQFNTWLALSDVTHTGETSATGGPAVPSNSVADATCTTSSVDLT